MSGESATHPVSTLTAAEHVYPKNAARMSDTPQFHRKPVAPQIAPKIPSVPSSYKNREHQSTVGGDGLPVFRRKPVANQVTPTIPSVPASYKARKGGLQTKDSRSPTTSPSPPPKPESPRGPALVRHKTASSISFTPSGFSEKRSASVDGLEDTEVSKSKKNSKRSSSQPRKKRTSSLMMFKIEKDKREDAESGDDVFLRKESVHKALEEQEVKWGSGATPSELLLILQQEAGKLNKEEERQLTQVSGEDGDESSVRIVVPKGGNVEAQLKALADVKKEYQREQEREARKLRRKSRSGAEINLVRSDTYDGALEAGSPSSHDDELSPRSKVVKEVYDTEKAYVHDLRTMVDIYVNPLKGSTLFSSAETSAVFSNIDILLQVNSMLLDALTVSGRRVDETDTFLALDWHMVDVGAAFLHIGQMLKVYATFCINQTAATQFVQDKLQKNPEFAKFCDAAKNKPECRRLDLESFLIKPMQRITKYPLLLRELIKTTPKTHPQYKDLIEAFKVVEECVTVINERKRVLEMQMKIIQISRSIESKEDLKLLSPGRSYVREGKMTIVSKSLKTEDAYYFLFNDLLLIVKEQVLGSSFKLKHRLELDQLLLAELVIPNMQFNVELVIAGVKGKIWIALPSSEEKVAFVAGVNQNCQRARQGMTLVNKEGEHVPGSSPSRTASPSRRSPVRKRADSSQAVLERFARKPIPKPPSAADAAVPKPVKPASLDQPKVEAKPPLQPSPRSPRSPRASPFKRGVPRMRTASDVKELVVKKHVAPLQNSYSSDVLVNHSTKQMPSPNRQEQKLERSSTLATVVPPCEVDHSVPKAADQAAVYAKAKYKYAANDRTELSFAKGDLLFILNQHSSGWWDARLEGRTGIVPSNYLTVLDGKIEPSQPPSNSSIATELEEF